MNEAALKGLAEVENGFPLAFGTLTYGRVEEEKETIHALHSTNHHRQDLIL